MIAIQSMWTETSFWKMTRGTALIHTLSACYAARHFEKLNLITDAKGAEIAIALGWRYHDIQTKLSHLCTSELRHIWAMGKLYAIALQREPFCHLDNDVLIKKPFPDRILTARIFAQGRDKHEYYGSKAMKQAMQTARLGGVQLPYNTGVIGGTDVELLKLYGERAFNACREFGRSSIDGTTISMAVEQSWLGNFARNKGAVIEELLPYCYTDEDVEKVGYVHLIGRSKHRPEIQAKCEARLRQDFPEEYRAFNEGFFRLLDCGFLEAA